MSLRSDFRLSFQLPHLRLRLVQPEAHVHFAVHRRRRRQMLSSLLVLVGLPEELAQMEMAVGRERTHAELASQGQGLAVVAFRRLESRRITMGSDFTEQAEAPRLVPALPTPVKASARVNGWSAPSAILSAS